MSHIHNFIIGVIVSVLFGIILFFVIPNNIDIPSYLPPFVPGPDTWPKVIVELGFALGLLLSFLSLKKIIKSDFDFNFIFDYLKSNVLYIKRFFFILFILIGYTYLISIVGFPLSSMMLLAVLLFSTGTKKNLKLNIIVSLSFPCILYFIFTKTTNTPFPVGSFWSFIGLN